MRWPAPEAVATTVQRYETVLDWRAFDRWLKKIRDAELVAVDTETTSLDYMAAEVVGLSLAVAPGEAAYIPVAHDYPGAPDQLPREQVLEKLQDFLEDPRRRARSATTSSTTPTCWRGTAYSSPACASIRCWSPTY